MIRAAKRRTPPMTLDQLRRYAVARSLFAPTTLGRAISKLGFVQADPIRAPARAQDLTLRHRVLGYRAGDLERRYPHLDVEEDFFVNYGFLPRATQQLMHPRVPRVAWTPARRRRAQTVLEFVIARGTVHPRAVDAHFAHGKVSNWFGGSSNATTQLLDEMHYRGLLRVARRDGGTRVYGARAQTFEPPDRPTADERFDSLIDVIVRKYAPLPAASLGQLVSLLVRGVPQWARQRAAALARARLRHAGGIIAGTHWYWPPDESPAARRWQHDDRVRLLTPFDPIVWDRRRFAMLWDWAYRFEAYTPTARRVRGYYALPMLWGDRVIGWSNLSTAAGTLAASFGYATGSAPEDSGFNAGLAAEIDSLRHFLEPRA